MLNSYAPDLRVMDLTSLPNWEAHLDDILQWLHQAGSPLVDWLYGNSESARRVMYAQAKLRFSELSVERISVVVAGSIPVGVFVGMRGTDFAEVRPLAAFSILKSCGSAERSAITLRMRELSEVFPPVPADAYLLSRITIKPSERGKGIGRRALLECFSRAREAHCRNLQLQVHAESVAARHLYESCGLTRRSSFAVDSGRLVYLDMQAAV